MQFSIQPEVQNSKKEAKKQRYTLGPTHNRHTEVRTCTDSQHTHTHVHIWADSEHTHTQRYTLGQTYSIWVNFVVVCIALHIRAVLAYHGKCDTVFLGLGGFFYFD